MMVRESLCRLVVIATVYVYGNGLFCQVVQHKYWNNWYFGSQAGVSFNGPTPTVLLDNASFPSYSYSISDPVTGELLFYNDDNNVFDRTHSVMQNGYMLDSLFGRHACIPHPGNPDVYYHFQLGKVLFSGANYSLRYSVIDMSENGGNGAVIQKNILLRDSLSFLLQAGSSASGDQFYLYVNEIGSSPHMLHYVIDAQNGLDTIPQVGISTPPLLNISPTTHYGAAVSLQNDLMAMTIPSKCYLFHLDSSSGAVSSFIEFNAANMVSLELSPSGRYLYGGLSIAQFPYSGNKMVCYDILSMVPSTIETTMAEINTFADSLGGNHFLSLNPQGEIIVVDRSAQNGYQQKLSRIIDPDLGPAGLTYDHQFLDLTRDVSFLPWKFWPQGTYTGINESVENELSVYPNPAHEDLIFSKKVTNVKVYDVAGKCVLAEDGYVVGMDISSIPAGMYLLSYGERDELSATMRFVKQ